MSDPSSRYGKLQSETLPDSLSIHLAKGFCVTVGLCLTRRVLAMSLMCDDTSMTVSCVVMSIKCPTNVYANGRMDMYTTLCGNYTSIQACCNPHIPVVTHTTVCMQNIFLSVGIGKSLLSLEIPL